MGDSPPRAPRKLSGWKLFGLIAGALALCLLTYAVYIHSVANRRWEEMQKSLQEVRAHNERLNGPRPVLRGTAVPGNAWEDYSPALLTMKGAPSAVLGDYVTRGPKADRAKLEAALATYGPALDGLRKGAMRAHGLYRVKWEDGFAADIPGLLQSQNLANLAACRSRLLVEEGKLREAAELLLDTCQFGRDFGTNQFLISEMISIAIIAIALEELRDLILGGKLSSADLEQVARELEILDGSFPRNGHSMMNEVLSAGYGFLKLEGNLGEVVSSSGGEMHWNYFLWRAAFPSRLICADAYFIELDYMKRFAAADAQSWAACEAEGRKAQAEITKLSNPIARIMLPGLSGSNRAGRERRANLRLLRVAAQYRATGQVLELDDPFGARLLHSTEGGKLKVWSVGKDGIDGGGTGEWRPGAGPDIVLTVDR